jgi:hypothetical protein
VHEHQPPDHGIEARSEVGGRHIRRDELHVRQGRCRRPLPGRLDARIIDVDPHHRTRRPNCSCDKHRHITGTATDVEHPHATTEARIVEEPGRTRSDDVLLQDETASLRRRSLQRVVTS